MESNSLTSLLIITFLLGVIIFERIRNSKRKFSIQEFERFLRTKRDLEHAKSMLTEENVIRANSKIKCEHCNMHEYVEGDECLICETKIYKDEKQNLNYAYNKH